MPQLDSKFAGRVWVLARSAQGSRQLQEALEVAASHSERGAIAGELRGHVSQALRCPHANHVLQKCITAGGPELSQFIVDELLVKDNLVAQAARHRYGCRIVQQLLACCPSAQVSEVTERLLGDAVAFSCHPFGGYVMQQILHHGTEDQQYRLARALEQNASAVGRSTAGCGVMAAAMQRGAREDDTVWLARAVLREPGLLGEMARTRRGNAAVLAMLEVLTGAAREEAVAQLLEGAQTLQVCRYGRLVAEYLEPGLLSCAQMG